MTAIAPATGAAFLTGQGRMASLIQEFDWSATSLGVMAGWPGTLRSTLSFILEAPLPLVLLWGPEGTLLYNDAYATFAGSRHPHILGQSIAEAWPEAADFHTHVLAEAFRGQSLSYKDAFFELNRGGTPEAVWLDLYFSAVRDRRGRPAGVLGVVLETTKQIVLAQRQQESSKALRESEAQLRALTAALPQIIWTADPGGHYDFFNERWRELTGLEPERTDVAAWLSAVHPEDREKAASQWQQAVRDGQFYETEYRLRWAGHGWRWYLRRALPVRDEDTGQIIRWLGTCTDIEETVRARMMLRQSARDLEARVHERTRQLEDEQQERLRAQEQLRQAQKMEAIGNLTGGIAHDFNNLLQVIHGNLELLGRDVSASPATSRRVDNALAAVRRGARLAQQLLAFGRRQPLQPQVVNVGRFISGVEEMLRRTLGEQIEIRVVVEPGLGNTLVDPGQVENALLNLAINARDAMDGAGVLTIEAANVTLDEAFARRHADVAPGAYVMLAVGDTGEGIAPDILDQVFEPFFTTKPEGKGSGLGLSMVYGFVRQSGGHVQIESAVGRGTTVRLYLPSIAAEETVIARSRPAELGGGGETVLVVEDDDAVREVVIEMVRGLGYKVVNAADAQSAMTVLRSGLSIDLLFTDVVMPGALQSTELADQARRLLPGIAVLFTSGYAENAIVHEGRLDAGVELLSKPYTREDLARRLRQILSSHRGRHAAPA